MGFNRSDTRFDNEDEFEEYPSYDDDTTIVYDEDSLVHTASWNDDEWDEGVKDTPKDGVEDYTIGKGADHDSNLESEVRQTEEIVADVKAEIDAEIEAW